jgi:hypothetical protein
VLATQAFVANGVGGGQVGAARALHRRGGRVAVAVSVSVAGDVPLGKPRLPSGSVKLAIRPPPPTSRGGLLDSFAAGGIMAPPTGGAKVERSIRTRGAVAEHEPRKELPASHVARPHPSHPVRLRLTRTVGDGTVTITGILKEVHGSSDVLPERVRPKGEPTEESESQPTGEARRKGPRRRGR